MKRGIFKQITMMAAAFGVVSCISGDIAGGKSAAGDKTGKVIIGSFGISQDVRNRPTGTRAEGDSDINTASFDVRIDNAAGIRCLDVEYGEIEPSYTFPVGDYNLCIQSHDVADFEWEDTEDGGVHYYYSGGFRIESGPPTELTGIECKVSNILVSATYSDKMLELMDANDAEITIKVGSIGPVTYLDRKNGIDKRGIGCFRAEAAGGSSLVWDFSGLIEGVENRYQHFNGFVRDVKAGEHRILNFDIEKGKGTLPFDIVATVTTYDVNLNISIDEDIIGYLPSDNPPVIEGVGFDIDERREISLADVANFDAENPDPNVCVVVNIETFAAPIEEFWVSITSTNPGFSEIIGAMNLAAPFDLAHTDAAVEGMFRELGLPCGDEVLGKDELVFDITTFVPLMAGYVNLEDESQGDFSFALEVIDKSGKRTLKTIQLRFVE